MDGDASFGHWLRLRRKALQLSCAELARRVGCATITLHKIEADERRPSQPLAAKLAEQTGMAPHERPIFIKVARRELGVDRLALPEQIADRPALPSGASLHAQMPIPLTPLIGRTADAAAVRAMLLNREVRLLTLIGAPGIGKTRLSLQVATELRDAFADGVVFIALAPIRDPELVIPTIAQAFAVSERLGQPLLERLQAYLRDRNTLLVLDNFEQVMKAAPQLAAMLSAAPKLTLLVTSREALHLSGEHRFAVPPLALPDVQRLAADADLASTLAQYTAVELFVARARALAPGFALTDANAATVATICTRLDGLPLAIELAAARVVVFTPAELLARLDQRFALLTGGAVDLPTRQQTLRRALDWSYDLLDQYEQTLFRRLGVFVGGCTLEAAECMNTERRTTNDEGAESPGSAASVVVHPSSLDLLAALIDKSLLQHTMILGSAPRFTMLETIREYALERLIASGEGQELQRQHAMYYLGLAETAGPALHGPQKMMWLERLELEHDNLRVALRWALDQDMAELAARLGKEWRRTLRYAMMWTTKAISHGH